MPLVGADFERGAARPLPVDLLVGCQLLPKQSWVRGQRVCALADWTPPRLTCSAQTSSLASNTSAPPSTPSTRANPSLVLSLNLATL
eukprot:2817976-Rhodomonas_salina.4